MKIKEESITHLIQQIEKVLAIIEEEEHSNGEALQNVCNSYRKSAKNLIHYQALRRHDIRDLQKKLKNLGMSRFANAGSHVKASLLKTQYILQSLIDQRPNEPGKAGLSIKNGSKLLNQFSKELLGYRSKGRRVRIMVTQPTESAYNYPLVLEMVKNGMNCARINCAHDGPEVWKQMIDNIHRAAASLGKKVKITMDLAGPKIRTGEIVPGAEVKKFSPERDEMGNILSPATIVLVDEITQDSEPNTLPIEKGWRDQLQINDVLKLIDTRKKERKLKVVHIGENEVYVNAYETAYIATGTRITSERSELANVLVGEIPPIEQSILLRTGDSITISKSGRGEPAQFDEDGNLLKQAHITCQVPEIFERVKLNETILFDDGKIEGIIESCTDESFEVKITRAKEMGSRLKAEKGMNFPTSDLRVSGLTSKDKEDLRFVVEHADVINFSFVNSVEDVNELYDELEKLDALDRISVILKIETRRAYDNLPDILLSAMRSKYVGVMIARGDLAVETGWDNIGWVQKEILAICNAAHVPVVWATQVLENLAKKGLPSRSEITDATTSLKAECVMLNKGAYINDAISLLNRILGDMENFEEKNESMLPPMEKLLT